MGGRSNTGSRNTMTLAEAATTVTREYRSRTNAVDDATVMQNAYFKNAADLVATIAAAENHGFDILDRRNSQDYGTILYTWAYGSEGDAYEVYWERTHSNPDNPAEVQIRRFKHLEEGEW